MLTKTKSFLDYAWLIAIVFGFLLLASSTAMAPGSDKRRGYCNINRTDNDP